MSDPEHDQLNSEEADIVELQGVLADGAKPAEVVNDAVVPDRVANADSHLHDNVDESAELSNLEEQAEPSSTDESPLPTEDETSRGDALGGVEPEETLLDNESEDADSSALPWETDEDDEPDGQAELPANPATPRRSTARRSRRASEYDQRAAELEALLRRSDGRLAEKHIADGLDDLVVVRGRLAIGTDSTVVALAGGTGSGKSSLFNAISGVHFADVGVRRPTTSLATACYWGEPVEALLDWLDVLPARRHQRESLLDADDETEMHGLVLLDLPDHDSIVDAHRFEVNRILPKVDLLIWVVDPQKYADQALHAGYLRDLVGHESALLVLLNQCDTLPGNAVDTVVNDISRLLEHDGLADIEVMAVSARTGAGLPDVRAHIAQAVARASKSAERVDAALTIAASRLAEGLGTEEIALSDLPTAETVDEIAAAAGVDQLSDAAARRRVGPTRRGTQTPPITVQADRVDRARKFFIDAAGTGLPSYWVDYLSTAVPDAESLSKELAESLKGATLPVKRSVAQRLLGVLAGICLAGFIAAAIWLGLILGGIVEAAPALGGAIEHTLGAGRELPIIAGLGSLAAAGIFWWIRHGVKSAAARNARHAQQEMLRAAIAKCVDERMVVSVGDVLEEHRHLRQTLDEIAGNVVSQPDQSEGVMESEDEPVKPVDVAAENSN